MSGKQQQQRGPGQRRGSEGGQGGQVSWADNRAAGSRGASPQGPHTRPHHSTPHLLLAGAEKGMAVKDNAFFSPIQLCGGCVIHNNTTALPRPQKKNIKSPKLRPTSPQTAQLQTPPPSTQTKHFLSSSV